MNYSPFKIFVFLAIFISAGLCMPTFASIGLLKQSSVQKKFELLENSLDGKIGVYAINTENNQHIEYRANEFFPIQSTFKLILVSAFLKKSMADKQLLQQNLRYTKQDLIPGSPITEKHLDSGMTIFQLCAAAMRYSDNTATNLLMKKIGGPKAVSTFARSIGDQHFRIDHWEPYLNSDPSDRHDSSTPMAMEQSLQKLILGNILGAAQRKQLVGWMKSNTTGNTKIRAGVPEGWLVADKTGSSTHYGVSNDIAVLWPPHHAPIVVALYSVRNQKDAAPSNNVIAATTRILIDEFMQHR